MMDVRKPYIIRQPARRRGLFSLVASVACHIDYAISHGLEPYVDFETSRTIYNDGEIAGTRNAWNYYFEPVSSLRSLDEIGDDYVVSSTGFPPGYDFTLQQNPGLHERVAKRLVIRADIEAEVNQITSMVGSNVLGIQFRGQEMKYFRGHHLPITKPQMRQLINHLVNEHGFTSVFVVSEDQGLVDFVDEVAPVPVRYTDAFRLVNKNAYAVYPREHHRYLLGREILIDALLLSKCGGLIHCSSNVGQFARFLCDDAFNVRAEVLNWQNTRVFPFNYLAWPLFHLAHELRRKNSYLQQVKCYKKPYQPYALHQTFSRND